MKILIITPGYGVVPDYHGGAVEKLVQTLVDQNEKKGKFEFDVISVDDGLKFDVSKYKRTNYYYINNKNIFYSVDKLFRAIVNKLPNVYIGNAYIHHTVKKLKCLNCDEYDCVIIENNPLYILKIKNLFKCPIYLHLHNDRLNISSKMCEKIYKLYYKIITVSNFLNYRVEEIGKLGKTITLYNGIDTSVFANKNIYKIEKLKKDLNISNEKVILYTGRILKIKGVLPMINVFNKINLLNKNIKLLIIGDVSNTKNTYVKKVIDAASNNKNIILKGYVPNEEIGSYYQLSDIQIVPSICNEALGNTAIEGIASGLLVVVSNRGGLPEIVSENNGFVFDIENFEGNLLFLLKKLIENYDLYENIRENAKTSSLKFDKSNYFENFEKIVSR